MKKYIETKQIEAEPMTLGDFVQETGRNPYGKDIENHKETEKGYRVKYEDGYESWSPAKAFEKSYKCADTFLDRLHIEMKDLYDRLDKLVAFIDSGKMDEVVTDNYQKFLLRLQQVVMGNYVKTLECRIGCLDGAPNAPFNQMSFGVAIEALKFGLAIRRKGWNGKGLWVIKQSLHHIAKVINRSKRTLILKITQRPGNTFPDNIIKQIQVTLITWAVNHTRP